MAAAHPPGDHTHVEAEPLERGAKEREHGLLCCWMIGRRLDLNESGQKVDELVLHRASALERRARLLGNRLGIPPLRRQRFVPAWNGKANVCETSA